MEQTEPVSLENPVSSKSSRMASIPACASLLWQRVWRGNPPSLLLVMVAGGMALLMSVPVVYVMIRAFDGGSELWMRLLNQRIPGLLWNTLSLAAVVTFAGAALGVVFAFLVARTDLPGKRHWRWLLVMPLVVPPYVGTLSYIIVFGPRGRVADLIGRPPFSIYGSLVFTSFVLTMFCYPYAYLIAASSFRRMNNNLEEAAIACGLPYYKVLLKVVLPLMRPAIGAGALLIALYVVSDFGAIAMLRYDTFTRAIYFQITGRFDRSGAAVLSTVLILIALTFLWLEHRLRRNQKYFSSAASQRRPRLIQLGIWKIPALCLVSLVFTLSVTLPTSVLAYWSFAGIRQGALTSRFWGFAFNSLVVAGLASVICILFTLPVIYLKSRHPSVISHIVEKITFAGYALPGMIVALGVAFIFNRYIYWLNTGISMIVFAYFLRFFPQTLQAGDAALAQVPPRYDEAARSMGSSTWHLLWKVILPLVTPGLLAGGTLVFVSALKELPATLLLRPPGFDTLAVRVWMEAHEGFYANAALPALLLIIVSALPLKIMLRKH